MASDFSAIDTRLFAGALPGARGDGPSWAELTRAGVTVLFSLVPRPLSGQPGQLLREVHALVDATDGTGGADLAYLQRVVDRIEALRAARQVVYVHCVAGVSRTGLVLCAWRMKTARVGRDEALAWLRTKRPALAPNASFLALLASWERQA